MATIGTRRIWTKVVGAAALVVLPLAIPVNPAGAAIGPDQVLEPAGETSATLCPPGCTSGQTFVPTASNITAIDLALTASSGGNRIVNVEIRETDASGAVLGQTGGLRYIDGTVTADSWQHFDFAEPIAVTPGQTYYLGLVGSSSSVVPHGTGTDVDRYAGGTRYVFGGPAGGDLYFRTYGELDTSSDSDGDGVDDADDLCADTDVDAPTPLLWNKNRFWNDGTGAFVDGKGTPSGVTLADTGGCDGHQIIAGAGLGKGHARHGLSKGELAAWVEHVAAR